MEIVYLAKGERRPLGDRSLLIDCRRGRGGEELIKHSSGATTLRSTADRLDALIADMEQKGAARIYVRRRDNA